MKYKIIILNLAMMDINITPYAHGFSVYNTTITNSKWIVTYNCIHKIIMIFYWTIILLNNTSISYIP